MEISEILKQAQIEFEKAHLRAQAIGKMRAELIDIVSQEAQRRKEVGAYKKGDEAREYYAETAWLEEKMERIAAEMRYIEDCIERNGFATYREETCIETPPHL